MCVLRFFLGHLRFSASCHAAGVPHLADSGWLPYFCGDGLAWGWGCLCTGFYLVPVQLPLPLLPLRGSAPLPGASSCLAPACWSAPGVGLGGSLLRHLVFSLVPCSSSGPAACTVFPAAGSLWVFAPCVRVLQLHWCLLGLTVRSPCFPSLTLEWVYFWPTVSLAQGITLRPCLVQLHPGRVSH